MKVGTLCALASGKAFPCAWIKALCNLFRLACNRRLACPRAKVMVRFHAENVAFAGPAQSLLNVTNPIYRVRCDPRERDVGRQRPLYNLNCQGWLGGEIYKFRNMGCGKSCRITRPALRQIQGTIDKRVAASRIPPASISPRNRIPCMDGPLKARGNRPVVRPGQVLPCIRPVDGGDSPGPDEVRESRFRSNKRGHLAAWNKLECPKSR